VKSVFGTNGTLSGFPFAEHESATDPSSFLEKPCDILVLAAVEKTVTFENADKL